MIKKFAGYHTVDAFAVYTLDYHKAHVERFVLSFYELFQHFPERPATALSLRPGER